MRWALELKGIKYETRAVDLKTSIQHEAEYKKQNPAGYVPALVHDGKTMAESVAIIEWLEEKFPEKPLLSSDLDERAVARQLAQTINSGTQPIQNLSVMRRYSENHEERVAWNQHWIHKGLKVYEEICLRNGHADKTFSMSNEPGYADLFLIPQCYNAERWKVDLTEFPKIKQVYQAALTTEACKRSSPDAFAE